MTINDLFWSGQFPKIPASTGLARNHPADPVSRVSPPGENELPWIFEVNTERELIQQLAHYACDQDWIAAPPPGIVLCTTPVQDAASGLPASWSFSARRARSNGGHHVAA